MNLTARAARRLATGVGVACAAVLLPTAALASSAAAGAHAAATSFGRCNAGNTMVWVGQPGDGTAGPDYYQLEFSNRGHVACTLTGFPGVSTLRFGTQVGKPASHAGKVTTVTLFPGGTAHVVIAVENAGAQCPHPVNTTALRVYPPNETVAQYVPFPSQACPGLVSMSVDAVHPGTGIPTVTRS